MRTYKKQVVEEPIDVLTGIICDVCKKSFDIKDEEGIMEAQEFHYINFMGGYGSVFGDGVNVKLDICQHCLNEKLGKYLKFE
jgi:antitoxin CcdA